LDRVRACPPVRAIFPEDDLSQQWKRYIEMNADYYRLNAEAFKSKWGEEP
jgi:hypothetical protein